MQDQIERPPASCIKDEAGAIMIAIEKYGREGDSIRIYGRVLGDTPAKLYISPEDYRRMLTIILKSPAIIFYAFALPFILLKRRRKKIEQ